MSWEIECYKCHHNVVVGPDGICTNCKAILTIYWNNLDKMRITIHYYQWFIADWAQSETRMSLNIAERGLYRELLDCCWREGSIPADSKTLIKLCATTEREFKSCWDNVKKQFTEIDGRLHHARVDAERPKMIDKLKGKQDAGRLGGIAKANAIANAKPDATANATADALAIKNRAEQNRAEQRERAAPATTPASNLPAPDDTSERLEALAKDAPNQQDYQQGINAAAQAIISAGNPMLALGTMERNIPGWWAAMREGRVRMKPLRYVIQDGDWTREAPNPPAPKQSTRYDVMDEVRKLQEAKRMK